MRAPVLALAVLAACAPAPPDSVSVRLTTDADPAIPRMNVTQWNWAHLLVADDAGGLHAVWTELGTTNVEYPADQPDPLDLATWPAGAVRYARSLDGGVTWSSPLALTPSAPGTDSPNVAVVGSALHVIFRAEEQGRLAVWSLLSPDLGDTWGDPVLVSDEPAGTSASPPSGAAASGGVYAVWAAGTPKEVRLARSDDGATWKPSVEVSVPDGFSSWTPSVAAFGDAVHVAWTDERDDLVECTLGGICREEEYYRGSFDGGASWGDETRLTFDPPGSPAASWAPSIAVWEDQVHVAYFDERSGTFVVYHRRSIDAGETWEPETLLSVETTSQKAVRPSVAARSGDVAVAWFDFTDFEADVWTSRSADGGQTWSPPLDLTPSAPGAARIPSVAIAPDASAHAIWYDTRASDGDGPRVEVFYARF